MILRMSWNISSKSATILEGLIGVQKQYLVPKVINRRDHSTYVTVESRCMLIVIIHLSCHPSMETKIVQVNCFIRKLREIKVKCLKL